MSRPVRDTAEPPTGRPGKDPSRSGLKSQFALPHGALGYVTGWVMVKAGEYSGLNEAAIELLSLRGHERVLEIGFGPGEAIHLLTKRYPACQVAGVDPSETMLSRARRRNRTGVRAGQVDLRLGVAEHLSWPDGTFDAIFAVNSAQLWIPLSAGINEVGRVLAPGGRVVLALHERCVTREGESVCGLDLRPQLVDGLTAAGLVVTSDSRPGRGGTSVYITGNNESLDPA